MDALSFLETTAEISVAFTGFISVFFILARRTGSFHPVIAISIRIILIAGISCPFYAALPLILLDAGLAESLVWRVSGGVVLALAILINLYLFRRRDIYAPKVDRTTLFTAYSLNAITFVLPIANVIGFPFEPSSAAHLATIWSILGIASVNFVGLVLYMLGRPERPDGHDD